MNINIRKLVTAALLAALTCAATMLIRIPSPLNGYINLGDSMVLTAGWLLSPGYGFLAAGIGSGLADLFAGYTVYAPATFAIKGLMALAVFFIHKLIHKKAGDLPSRIVGGIVAESIMVLGYFVFEGFMYGFEPSAVNIPANCVQGVAGIIIGTVLIRVLKRVKLTDM